MNTMKSPHPNQKEILVVDDAKTNLELLEDILMQAGYTVRPALNAYLALEEVKIKPPDLILLDVKMPGMDGYELCRRLKADKKSSRIPIIFISALSEINEKVKGFEVGGVDYIAKPFKPQEILVRVNTHIRLQELTEGLEQKVRQRTVAFEKANRQLRKEIIERKRAQKAQSWEAEVNLAAAQLSRSLLSSASIDDVSFLVLGHAKRITKSEFGFVGYIDPDTGFLVTPTLPREKSKTPDQPVVFEKFNGLWGWVLNNQKPLLTNAPSSDPRSTGTPVGHIPLNNFLAAPASSRKKLVGLVAVTNSEHGYKELDLRAVERFADLFAIAIQHKRDAAQLKKHRDHLEELVNDRTAELHVATKRAEAANHAKSDFLARMSHEIRTPINAITGLVNLVLKSDLTTEQRDYLSKVGTASKNLLDVINDILDFSKVEAGQLALDNSAFRLDDVLEQLADVFSERIAQKELELVFTLDADVPRDLVGDAGRLSQILINFIENAIKFTDRGEIVVGVEVDPEARRGQNQVGLRFRVQDSGIGIAPELLPKLFEAFTQVDRTTGRNYEGTGLGLAICRRLVDMMAGRIWAESLPGKGSNFYFSASLALQDTQTRPLVAPEDLRGLKTLVVDDNRWARSMMHDLLRSMSFKVVTAQNGAAALAQFRRAGQSDPFQLVLLDWKMPEMDGLALAEQIRKEAEIGGLVKPPIIIMVTAHGYELVRRLTTAAAIEAHLLKPIKASSLFNTILSLFGHCGEAAAEKEPVCTHTHHLDQLTALKDRRVLVVEDSPFNRDIVVALLQPAGFDLDIVENGKVAVEKVLSGKQIYDAVLMDIQMPLMDGYQATAEIRKDPRFRNLPIIALTAHAMKGEREKCLMAGMDDYISKPFDEDQLFGVLLKWLTPGRVGRPDPGTVAVTFTDAKSEEGLIQAPDFDIKGALKRIGGEKDLYARMLKRFEPEFSDAPRSIRQALDTGDLEAAERAAHSVKGVAGSVGVLTLVDAALQLELAITNRSEDIEHCLEVFQSELSRAFAMVTAYLKKEGIALDRAG